MSTTTIHYGLLIALAIALVFCRFHRHPAAPDRQLAERRNRAGCAVVSGGRAGGLSLWPDVAIQLGVACAAFVLLCRSVRAQGYGRGRCEAADGAGAVDSPPEIFMQLLVIMAIAGGVLTIAMGAWHFLRRQKERLAIPYGVAIAFGGLWVLAVNYLPAAALAASAQ